jgi:hypothetical protein
MFERYCTDADLTHAELWLRYFELGGQSAPLEFEAILFGALQPSGYEHDILAQVLNERFVELGGTYLVPYTDER